MKKMYSRAEMLAVWRELKGYAPVRADIDVSQRDGIDWDLGLGAEIDAWYGALARTAPVWMLWPEDLAGRYVLPLPEDGGITLSLPAEVVRVTCVRLSTWRCAATVVCGDGSREALCQSHRYTRACIDRPVAVWHADGTLSLYPASGLDALERLECVTVRDGEYRLDTAALSTVMRPVPEGGWPV